MNKVISLQICAVQLHLWSSMLRAYSMRLRRSEEHPQQSSVLRRSVVDTRSSLMYVSRYSSFWLHKMILVWSW